MSDPAQEDGPAHPRWLLAACMLASSLAFIDGSVVNVALSAIAQDLHADAAGAQWTISAYLLPLSALLLLGGAAGDRWGRRRTLAAGIALFAAASAACAVAPGLPVLLAARAAQGLGAALVLPNSLGLLGASFRGEARGRAVGTWAIAGAAASAVGPPLGGWLVGSADWRAIFLINLPVAAAALAITLTRVEESRAGRGALDWAGAGLATVGLGAVTWGLTSWSSARRFGAGSAVELGVGAAALVLFVWTERRRGEAAMMPPALFGSRAFVGVNLLTFLLYGALGGLLVMLPFVLIRAGGYTALQAGMALLPFSAVLGLLSRYMGRLAARIGPRWPLSLGPLVTAAGFAALMRVGEGAAYWAQVFPAVLLIALGMAGAAAPLTSTVLAAVDEAHTGTASGFNSAVARTGGLIATALAGAVLAARGTALLAAFHGAALTGAVLALAAAAIGWATLGEVEKG